MKGGSRGGKGGQIGPSGFIVRKIASFLTLIPGWDDGTAARLAVQENSVYRVRESVGQEQEVRGPVKWSTL